MMLEREIFGGARRHLGLKAGRGAELAPPPDRYLSSCSSVGAEGLVAHYKSLMSGLTILDPQIRLYEGSSKLLCTTCQ